jgi:hypothetical protein
MVAAVSPGSSTALMSTDRRLPVVSYAQVASTTAADVKKYDHGDVVWETTSLADTKRIQQLSDPPPRSFLLDVCLQLLRQAPLPRCSIDRESILAPLEIADDDIVDPIRLPVVSREVYLMDPAYLHNWLVWALHQQTPATEAARTEEAIQLVALRLGLQPVPQLGASYDDPGPIDSRSLSTPDQPLLLASTARLCREYPVPSNGKQSVPVVAVPHDFYEALRSVHGVICNDSVSISFQHPHSASSDGWLLLHQPCDAPQSSSSSPTQRPIPQPIEFPRQVVMHRSKLHLATTAEQTNHHGAPNGQGQTATSLMEKLLLEERQRQAPAYTPAIEVHPVRVHYRITGDGPSNGDSFSGLALISHDAPVVAAVKALMMQALQPPKSLQCVRAWGRWDYRRDEALSLPTTLGDGYELLETDHWDASDRHPLSPTLSAQKIGTWLRRLASPATIEANGDSSAEPLFDLELLLETRQTAAAPWPRTGLELSQRLSIGDWIDAQDDTGKWYEARVCDINDAGIKVHYLGWASRWDTVVSRGSLPPPQPLWSCTSRWREAVKVGDVIEVRDASSVALRPKWYWGVVRQVGRPNDPPQATEGGAELETYEMPGSNVKAPLLILGRTQQILVQVDQEQAPKLGVSSPPSEYELRGNGSAASLEPKPPFRRWVNLYGEEICQAETHLKIEKTAGPATLRYEVDSHRKPVEIMKGHPMHGSGFLREALRGNPPAPGICGLHQLGNSCFLNSTVSLVVFKMKTGELLCRLTCCTSRLPRFNV